MRDDGIAAMVMLGLPGFRVLAVSEYAGELEEAVETDAAEGWCSSCGARARLHDRRPSWVRDLPAGGRPVTLGVGQAGVALRRAAVREADLDGDLAGDPAAGGVD